MTMRPPVFVFAFAFLLLFPPNVGAQSVGASFRAGTGGIGVGVSTQFMPTLNGRLGISYFTLSIDGEREADDLLVQYDGDGDVLFVSALADWFPFQNGIRVSGGAMYNGLAGSGSMIPIENLEIGRNSYTPAETGDLSVDVEFASKISPYLGIGYGNEVTRKVGFLLDLGVLYAGSPDVTVEATGMMSPTASQESQIEEDLEWVTWYPILSVGFNVRLN